MHLFLKESIRYFRSRISLKICTVLTTRSLPFAIFWEIFENCQLKTLLNSKILQIVTFFLKILLNDLMVGTVFSTLPVKTSRTPPLLQFGVSGTFLQNNLYHSSHVCRTGSFRTNRNIEKMGRILFFFQISKYLSRNESNILAFRGFLGTYKVRNEINKPHIIRYKSYYYE